MASLQDIYAKFANCPEKTFSHIEAVGDIDTLMKSKPAIDITALLSNASIKLYIYIEPHYSDTLVLRGLHTERRMATLVYETWLKCIHIDHSETIDHSEFALIEFKLKRTDDTEEWVKRYLMNEVAGNSACLSEEDRVKWTSILKSLEL